MPTGLEMLHQQPLGPLHRHRQPCPKPAKFVVEPGEPGDVMGQADLAALGAVGVDHTQLMVTGAPVDPDEELLPVDVQHCLHQRPP